MYRCFTSNMPEAPLRFTAMKDVTLCSARVNIWFLSFGWVAESRDRRQTCRQTEMLVFIRSPRVTIIFQNWNQHILTTSSKQSLGNVLSAVPPMHAVPASETRINIIRYWHQFQPSCSLLHLTKHKYMLLYRTIPQHRHCGHRSWVTGQAPLSRCHLSALKRSTAGRRTRSGHAAERSVNT